MAVFEYSTFFIINIALLAIGPLIVAVLITFASTSNKLFLTRRGWLRFPLALTVSLVVNLAFGYTTAKLNPLVCSPILSSVVSASYL